MWQGKRQTGRQSQGWREGENTLRLISRHKDFFKKKSEHESNSSLPPEAHKGSFLANVTGPGYFSPLRERFDSLAEDGEKVVYLLH